MEQTEKLAAEMAAQYERQLRHDFKRAESALRRILAQPQLSTDLRDIAGRSLG